MNRNEIQELMTEGLYQGKPVRGMLEETNISWVILGEEFVFKIKKPIKLTFLDYSTLGLRKLNCEKELELNKRFSPIYLSVLPIIKSKHHWVFGEAEGEIIDYAVCMMKMESDKRMDLLLGQNKVNKEQVIRLAKQVAAFHLGAEVIRKETDIDSFFGIFNDLESVSEIANQYLGQKYVQKIASLMTWSDAFVKEHFPRFESRERDGFFRDVHGDLHSRNIFLYEEPIIFDCIEFEESFRQIDVLYEVAFICMDLENFGKKDLSDIFLDAYLDEFYCMVTTEDTQIFQYYKCLRANIRAKVNLLDAKTEADIDKRNKKLESGKKYLDLAWFYSKYDKHHKMT
jgi:aminoglycoside phosphotransferase family enzyme